MPSTNKIYLTGADCFILAMEQHSMRGEGHGNTCCYLLELDGRLDAGKFRRFINSQEKLRELASLRLGKTALFGLPFWEQGPPADIAVSEWENSELIPAEIMNRNLSHSGSRQFAFDIIYRHSGECSLVFSWNHLLLDAQGAAMLLKDIIAGNASGPFTTDEQAGGLSWANIRHAAKAVRFVKTSSAKPLASVDSGLTKAGSQCRAVIAFNEEETKLIEKNALQSGSKFGPGAFFLAVCARNVKALLEHKNSPAQNFWIPVPNNRRKKGALAPLLGNHLSFLFYRIPDSGMETVAECVGSLNEQMAYQMRQDIPGRYEMLLRILKRLPGSLYYRMIRQPHGNSLAGFLFTMAAEHPEALAEVQGLAVKNAWSFPPNFFPPGLTFAFMRFKGMLRVMILSYDEVLNAAELNEFTGSLKKELLGQDKN